MGELDRVHESSPGHRNERTAKIAKLFNCAVDVGIYVIKNVENQTKGLCPLISSEKDTETKIKPRPPKEEVPDRRPDNPAR